LSTLLITHRQFRALIYCELEDVGSSIVSDDVEVELRPSHFSEIEICVEYSLLIP
jgi:hypothetical protein